MKDVKELSVFERRLFPIDVIPFRHVVNASNLNKINASFVFKETNIGEDANNILTNIQMKIGEFKYDNKLFPIDHLLIDQRSINFKIQSDSSIAEKYYSSICNLLREIDPLKSFKEDSYIIKTVHTNCVVTLDFNFKDLLSRTFTSFLAKEASKIYASAVNNKAKVQILPKSLVFDVDYQVTDKSLLEDKIRIGSKNLIIEPRAGTNLKDNIYYTSSPTDTKTHIQLLTELNSLFSK